MDKDLSETLLLSNHTFISGIIGEGALVNSELTDTTYTLKDISNRERN